MDSCEKYIEMLSAHIDGTLSPEDETELAIHLETCEACSELLSLMDGARQAMGDMLVEPPEELSKGIMYKVGLESGKTSRPRRFIFGRFTAVAAMLAVILLAVYAFPNLFNRSKTSDTAETGTAANAEMATGAPLMENAQFGASKDSEDQRAYATADAAAGETELPAAMSAPTPAPAGGSGSDNGEAAPEEAPSMIMSAGPTEVTGAPALPFSRLFSAILVYHGNMPEALAGYPSEVGSETEIFVFVPAVDLADIVASGDYEVYLDEPNTDPSADTAIVVIYGGQ